MTKDAADPSRYPNPWPILDAAKAQVDAHIEGLDKAASRPTDASAMRGIAKERALLNAWSARESAAMQMIVMADVVSQIDLLGLRVEAVKSGLDLFGERMNSNASALIGAIERFTVATNAGATRMEQWNR